MFDAGGFNLRLRQATKLREVSIGRDLEQEAVGQLVGGALGVAPISQAAVSRWYKSAEPGLATIQALAEILNVDPGWLAFGDASGAPAPVGWTPATSAEIQRAVGFRDRLQKSVPVDQKKAEKEKGKGKTKKRDAS